VLLSAWWVCNSAEREKYAQLLCTPGMASHQMQQGADAAEPPVDEAGAAREPAHVSAEEPETSGRQEVQFAPGVLAKLLAFSLMLAALPLSLLFATRHGYLDGGRPSRCWFACPGGCQQGQRPSHCTDAPQRCCPLSSGG
jgi:hypothetical protein